MQADTNPMVEKILRDLQTVIKRDEDLEEFVIIPTIFNQNKSPVIHEQHNLGLEAWCVKHVFSYAYQKVLDVRKLISKRKLLYDEYDDVNRMILGVLLINPDVATFWNIRRELVCDNILDISQELRITKIVLSHKFKSNEAFAYRKWLLKRILRYDMPDKSRINNLLREERIVCNMTAEKYQNNYHSWSHRIWCLENLNGYDFDKWLVRELEYSENWINRHISENAGFHYRQYILNKLKFSLNDCLHDKYVKSFCSFFDVQIGNYVEAFSKIFGSISEADKGLELFQYLCLLTYDLELNNGLLLNYSEHETIWCHRRNVFHEIFSIIVDYLRVHYDNVTNLDVVFTDEKDCNIVDCNIVESVGTKMSENGEKYLKMLKYEKNIIYSTNIYKVLMSLERKVVEKYLKRGDRTKYLAQRHVKWMKYVLGYSDI